MKKLHSPLALMLLCVLLGVAAPAVAKKPARPDATPVAVPDAPALGEAAKSALAKVNNRVAHIDTNGLKALLQAKPETVVIDVRNPEELTLLGGYIGTAYFYNIPRGQLEFQIDTFVADKKRPVVVYSNYNQRSPLAAGALMQLGYTNVKNYADGFFAWKRAGLPVKYADKALDSFLYSKPQEVIPGVWSAIGATAPQTYENSGHNNNLSFVITEDGVLVMNGGANYLLAQSLHEEIKKLTKQPVKYVVLENAQSHAIMGAGYWKAQGAIIIAHKDAAHVIQQDGDKLLEATRARLRDKAFKTEVVMPDRVFEDKLELKLGSWKFEVLHLGPAHSPGDIMVWAPEKKLVISGDMAFHERMLPLFDDTNTAAWIKTWDRFEALGAQTIIPGHGRPTTIPEVTKYTKDYLVYLRAKVAEVIKNGGSLQDVYKVDQSPYAHLDTYDELARVNAGMVFRAMEFE
ncbi:MAG: MBL fold metallo-hydrolase [Burkholderiales bacterium]|nr:MBL fold metallo-hydrolase [Burkholderiales bacterium]